MHTHTHARTHTILPLPLPLPLPASASRPKYPAETTNFCRLPEVTVWPKFPKCKNEFVFLTYENKKGISFSFANLKTKNEKGIPFFVRKFENEKPVYTRTQMPRIQQHEIGP